LSVGCGSGRAWLGAASSSAPASVTGARPIPDGILGGSTGRIVAGHRYVEALLDLDDGGSDDRYTFFVDLDTFEVAAAFYDHVYTP